MSNPKRCAACKSLRRRCKDDCVLAPYFPSTRPQRFACVHRIFGASNVTKMLKQLPVHQRAEAADCMSFEAHCRVQDPAYGCVGMITKLQQEIYNKQCELAETRAQIAFHGARQTQLAQTQIQNGEGSSSNAYQQDPLHLDQLFLDLYQVQQELL